MDVVNGKIVFVGIEKFMLEFWSVLKFFCVGVMEGDGLLFLFVYMWGVLVYSYVRYGVM